MERIAVCVIISAYAILVDLQAAVLRSNAASIGDFQVLPMIIWGAILSGTAVVYIIMTFGGGMRSEIKKRRKRVRQKR